MPRKSVCFSLAMALFLVLSFFGKADDKVTAPAESQTTVEVSWEPVPNAVLYEVQFRPRREGESPHSFSTKATSFSANLIPGVYDFRLRASVRSGEWGPWSEPIEVAAVAVFSVPLLPTAGAAVIGDESPFSLVHFSWTPARQASAYRLRVFSRSSGRSREFIVKRTTEKKLRLRVGREYDWEVVPIIRGQVSYERSPERRGFHLLGPAPPAPVLKAGESANILAWEKGGRDGSFELILWRRDIAETDWHEIRRWDTPETKWEKGSSLAPGEYRLEVRLKAPHSIASEPLRFHFLAKPAWSVMREVTE